MTVLFTFAAMVLASMVPQNVSNGPARFSGPNTLAQGGVTLAAWQVISGPGPSTTGAQSTTNTTVALWGNFLPTATTCAHLVIDVSTLDASGFYDVGIYTGTSGSTGTLICHTGSIHWPSPGLQDFAAASGGGTLPAGKIWIAIVGNSFTGLLKTTSNPFMTFLFNTTIISSATAGVLNSSITLPSDTWAIDPVATNSTPALSIHN